MNFRLDAWRINLATARISGGQGSQLGKLEVDTKLALHVRGDRNVEEGW
jgi:hypothetical protein